MGQTQLLSTVRARGGRTGRSDGQGGVQTGFMDQHAATGGTDDGSDQFPRAQKTVLHSKRPHHTKKDRMRNEFESTGGERPFYGVGIGVSLMGPPSNQTHQGGGIPPPSPLFEGGSREPGTEVRGGYIESRGKPAAFSLPRLTVSLGHLVVHVWFLF